MRKGINIAIMIIGIVTAVCGVASIVLSAVGLKTD